MSKISVVIPCFNKANLIRPVIESVLAQTHQPDEIIVVDDKSTDHSVEIIESLPVKLLVHTQNLGVASARNTGFQASSGDVVVFIDNDAIAERKLIDTLQSVFRNRGSTLGGVGGRAIECNVHSPSDYWRALHANQDYGLVLKEDVKFLFGVCCSYRRDALQAINGFDPFFRDSVGEDADIGIRLHKAGYKLAYHPSAIVFHQHSDTKESLLNGQYRWAYWNYFIFKRHSLPMFLLYGGLFKNFFKHVIINLVHHHSLPLFMLDIQIFQRKALALRAARQVYIKDKSEFAKESMNNSII